MQTVIKRKYLWAIIRYSLISICCILLFYACSRRLTKTTDIYTPPPPPPQRYIYVETSILTDSLPSAKREIIETNRFKSIAPKITKVALKAPDYCYGQAASISDKQVVHATKSFIKSECGVEMGTLEKKLAEEGYTVYSWNIIDNIMKSQNKSLLLAAQEMGAEILFTVNMLEGIYASSDEYIKRSFFWSDKNGSKGNPANIVEIDRQDIRKIAWPYEDKLRRRSLGAFLDVTAVDVTTGQAIWFYKSGKYDIKKVEKPMTLVVMEAFDKWYWKIYMVDGIIHGQQNTSSSYEYDSTGTPLQLHNADKYYEKYIQEIVTDFIDSFKASRKSGNVVNR